jgi:DNA-directed RNA polymerase II subunit RPB1
MNSHPNTTYIKNISFGILSNETIKNITVLDKNSYGIEIPDLYDNLEPKDGGLIDSKMGITDRNLLCSTCGLSNNYCIGHYGHIELVEHVFHIGFLKYIKKILNCICIECSKLLVYKNENDIINIIKKKFGKNRFEELKNIVKNVNYCQKAYYGCGESISKISLDVKKSTGTINIIAEYKEEKKDQNIENENENVDGIKQKKKVILTPNRIYEIFSRISDSDCYILGLNPKLTRPENMIHKYFLVPPVQIRPSTRSDFMGSISREDDLTHKLADLVKANTRMRKYKEINDNENIKKYKDDNRHLLQFHIATYFDNETSYMPRSEQKGKIIQSLTQRLKSKKGRFRNNLMGKRVDFSARTVITSDPSLDINQLGVPIRIAKNVTYPEIVNVHNLEQMKIYVKNGRFIYPGANFIFTSTDPDNRPIDLRYNKGNLELKIGYVVERHLMNDDIVLLNRQPTLHKQSMMAHRIKIIDDDDLNTFRLNVTVTTPYNADFDGDEMNIHIPQSIQSKIELDELADVKKNIITATSSFPIIGIVQDGLIGSYNMTKNEENIDIINAMNLLATTTFSNYEYFKNKKKSYTGKEIMSLIIPKKININKKIGDNDVIKIVNGNIMSGYLSKETIGAKKKNNIIQLLWDEYGANETKKFLDNIQRMTNYYNKYSGFTMGIKDICFGNNIKDKINQIYNTKKLKVEHFITEIENNPGLLNSNLYEYTIFSEINVIRDNISELLYENTKLNNGVIVMMDSGSKGSLLNLAQMGGCIGLQAFDSNLVPKKINNRTLPYFFENDDTSISRGFIPESFYTGCTFPSFFFHNLTSREGLINSAVKTADTGYTERKLIKLQEDLVIKYDNTVRTYSDDIIQYIYGGTGGNTIKQYEHTFYIFNYTYEKIKEIYLFKKEQLLEYKYSEKDNQKYFKFIMESRINLINIKFKLQLNQLILDPKFMLPINLIRIVNNFLNIKYDDDRILSPIYILNEINKLIDNKYTKLVCLNNKSNTFLKELDGFESKYSMIVAIHEILAPKRCISEYKLTKNQFDDIINQIIKSYNNNIIEPGEYVGIVSAQSMGEPMTQMVLNTFHQSGVGSMMTTTSGIARIKEIISVTKNQKTPQMIIYLNDDYSKNRNKAESVLFLLEYTNINSIKQKISLYYDPNPNSVDSIMKNDKVSNVFKYTGISSSKFSNNKSYYKLPWLMKIVLNKEKLFNKGITLLDIKSKICDTLEKKMMDYKNIKKEEKYIFDVISHFAILSNLDNDDLPIIHFRFDIDTININIFNDIIYFICDKIRIKGLDGIGVNNSIIHDRKVNIDENYNIEDSKEYVLYIDGVNLMDIRHIKGIDLLKSYCNNFNYIYEFFGVEAARNYIFIEINKAYETKGSSINHQHISLLADLIAHTGKLISIDRHGMNKLNLDPLSRASFEETVEQLLSAAVFSEVDSMNSVSSRVMSGLVIKGGTGICDIMLDTDILEKSEYVEKNININKNVTILNKNEIINEILDKNENNNSSFFMPN